MAENPQPQDPEPENRQPGRQPSPQPEPPRRLTRGHDSKIAGVCGGIAEYFEVDPTIVRVIFIVLLLFPFFPFVGGLVLYFLLWLIMPEPAPGEGGGPASAQYAAPPGARRGGSMDGGLLLGGALLLLGFLFLFQRVFSAWWPGWWVPNLAMFAWPMLLIVIGALIIVAALGRRR